MSGINRIISLIIVLLLVLPLGMSEILVLDSNSGDTVADYSLSNDDNFIVSDFSVIRSFSVSSQNRIINLCACSVFVDKITLKNTGNVQDSYTISSDKDYVKLVPNYVILSPGQSIDIYNYIRPGCKDVSQNMVIHVESNAGIAKEMIQQVNSVICDNINITTIDTYLNSTPCQTSVAKFRLKNDLDFTEIYYLDTDVLPDYALFSQNPIKLLPHQSADVNLYFTPACEIYGQYDGSVEITTENTGLISQLPIVLDITQKYNYTITADKDNQVCNYLENKVPVTLKNNENFSNIIDLELENKRFFSLDTETVILGPYEEKTVMIDANPKWKVASPLVLKLNAVSRLGDIEKAIDITFDIQECYESSLLISDNNIKCSDDDKILFTLSNVGTKDDSLFYVETNSPGFEIRENNFFIRVGDNKIFSVYMNVSDDTKDYDLNMFVSLRYGVFIDESNYNIKVLSSNDCYLPEIDISDRITISNNLSVHGFTIRNTGIKNAVYELFYDGPAWTEIVQPDDFIELEPQQSVDLALVSFPTSDIANGSYDITLTLARQGGERYKKDLVIVLNHEKTSVTIFDFARSNYLLIILVFIILAIVIIIVNELISRPNKEAKETEYSPKDEELSYIDVKESAGTKKTVAKKQSRKAAKKVSSKRTNNIAKKAVKKTIRKTSSPKKEFRKKPLPRK